MLWKLKVHSLLKNGVKLKINSLRIILLTQRVGIKIKMNQEELHKNLEEWVRKHQKMEKTQQKWNKQDNQSG